MSDIRVFAGARALAQVRANGLRAEDISWLAGASGGPKWFVLYGMDRYLAGEFFAARQQPLRLIGSSAGAWRMACHAHPEPLAALERLAQRYAGQTYSAHPDRHEISREAGLMLDYMLGPGGAQGIVSNPSRRLYVIADRARGLLRSDNRVALNTGLVLAAFGNLASRRALAGFFERHVFHPPQDNPDRSWLRDLPTVWRHISEQNLRQVLMASGSIPQVMERVRVPDVPGAIYRDGGITDYHLALPFNQLPGLVLYPHFYAGVVPGWFDRFAGWRRANPHHFDNVVLVAPSRAFVRSLPLGKIPDRNDFRRLPEQDRIRYWQTVLQQSQRLGDALRRLVVHGDGVGDITLFEPRRSVHV